MDFFKCEPTKDCYKIMVDEREFNRLVDSNLSNHLFINSFIGPEMILTRGYPRVRDVLCKIFQYLDKDELIMADKITGGVYEKIYDFLLSLPNSEFIPAYRFALRKDIESSPKMGAILKAAMLKKKNITKKEFGDDELWETHKAYLRGSAAIGCYNLDDAEEQREYEIVLKLIDEYDGSIQWYKAYDQYIEKMGIEGELLAYMKSVEAK